MWLRRRRSPSAGTRAKKVPALARLRMANAERHAELDPTGHWLQEEGAVCRYFEELLSSSAAPDPRRTYGRDHLAPMALTTRSWSTASGIIIFRWARWRWCWTSCGVPASCCCSW